MKNLMYRMCLLCSVKTKLSRVLIQKAILQIIDARFPETIPYEHIHVVNRNLLDLLAVAAYLLNFEYDSTTTTL